MLTPATLQVCLRYFPGAPMALKSVSFQIYDREKVGAPFGRGLSCAEGPHTHCNALPQSSWKGLLPCGCGKATHSARSNMLSSHSPRTAFH